MLALHSINRFDIVKSTKSTKLISISILHIWREFHKTKRNVKQEKDKESHMINTFLIYLIINHITQWLISIYSFWWEYLFDLPRLQTNEYETAIFLMHGIIIASVY